jgi:hypothetical protein
LAGGLFIQHQQLSSFFVTRSRSGGLRRQSRTVTSAGVSVCGRAYRVRRANLGCQKFLSHFDKTQCGNNSTVIATLAVEWQISRRGPCSGGSRGGGVASIALVTIGLAENDVLRSPLFLGISLLGLAAAMCFFDPERGRKL